jgi:hypothetical protein
MESNSETTTFTDSIVFEIIKEFGERAQKGYEKYGTDMDRTDLSVADWAQHMREELMDGLVYLTRLKKDILEMQEYINASKGAIDTQDVWVSAEQELLSLTDEQFNMFKQIRHQDFVVRKGFNLPNNKFAEAFLMAVRSAKKLTPEEASLASKIGTQIVYTLISKPNETYTDAEPKIRKRYGFHR